MNGHLTPKRSDKVEGPSHTKEVGQVERLTPKRSNELNIHLTPLRDMFMEDSQEEGSLNHLAKDTSKRYIKEGREV